MANSNKKNEFKPIILRGVWRNIIVINIIRKYSIVWSTGSS